MENNTFKRELFLKTDFSQENIIDTAEKQNSYLIVTSNDKHLKVSPTSYFLLQSFSKGLSPEEIADSLNQNQTAKISAEKVIEAYENLVAKINFVDQDTSFKRRGFWFLWEILPSRIVERIAKHFVFFFNPIVFGFSLALIIATIFLNLQNNIFSNPITELQSPKDFWIGYILFLLSVIAHEFGHATASSKYEAPPSGIGFTIYLIFPAFYSDVTSSWKLKSKQRVVIGLGGIYFQLLVSAYYTILNTISGTGYFRVAILMIFANCLLNLNPFLKFDGYWIVSDLLGVVNLSQQPKRFVLYVYHRLRKIETTQFPWSAWTSAIVAVYSICSFLMISFFLVRYSSYFYGALQKYPYQVRDFFTDTVIYQNITFSQAHTFFISSTTIFIFSYFIYNILLRPIFTLLKGTPAVSVFLILFCLAANGFAQTVDSPIDDARIKELIRATEEKADKTKAIALNEYQSNFKRTVEFEDQNKKSVEVYEEYCLKNDKSLCRIVLIEKDGVPVSSKKIEKERKKVSKVFIKNNTSDGKKDPFGYGISINSLWVDPVVYLRACRISSFSEKIVEGRKTAIVRAGDCNIDNESAALKNQILFMAKTEAEIWIDVEDESVVRMNVYPKKEFASETAAGNPLIITENERMADGYWLSKRTRLETIGYKRVFPNLKDNWEYDFFGYRHLTVNVETRKPAAQ